MNQTFSDIKCEKWSEKSTLCTGELPNNGHVLDQPLRPLKRGCPLFGG